MERCPVCGTFVVLIWEHQGGNGRRWFSGAYWCEGCRAIRRASGSVEDGSKIVRSWFPACKEHGSGEVVAIGEDRFQCLARDCDRRFEVRGKKLIVTRKPARIEESPERPSCVMETRQQLI